MRGRQAGLVWALLTLALTPLLLPRNQESAAAQKPWMERSFGLVRDTQKIAFLLAGAEGRMKKDPRAALRDAGAAFEAATKIGLTFQAARARAAAAEAHLALQNPEKARELLKANQGLAEAWRAAPPPGVSAGEARAFFSNDNYLRGELELEDQNSAAALKYFRKALDAALESGSEIRPAIRAQLMRKAGLAHFYLAEYKEALKLFLDSLKESERSGDIPGRTASLYVVGYIYRELKDLQAARRYFQDCLKEARAAGDTYHISMSLNEIGNVSIFEGKPGEAREPKEEALKWAEKSGDDYTYSVCLHDMGLYFQNIGELDRALPFLEKSLALDEKIGQPRELAIALNNIASILILRGDFQGAVKRLRRAEELAEKKDLKSELVETRRFLASAFRAQGRLLEALEYSDKASALREEIRNEEQAREVAKDEKESRTKENEALRLDNQIKELGLGRARLFRIFLMALSMLALALAGLALNRSRIRTKANRALHQANEEIRRRDERLEEANARLDRLVRIDALTELDNRREMEDRLTEESIRFERTGRPFALIMIDIDKFKSINDRFGHQAGDAALKACAAVFRRTLRAVDTAARWGGDEFLVLLPETDIEGARTAAAKLKEAVALVSLAVDGGTVGLSLSAGVAAAQPGRTADAVIAEADRDMYRGRSYPAA